MQPGACTIILYGIAHSLFCAPASAFLQPSIPRDSHFSKGSGSGQHFQSQRLTVRHGTVMSASAKQVVQSALPAVVILPGFGNAAVDYTNPFGAAFETSISYALQQRGFDVTIMPLERGQWLNVLWGIFTLSFWLGKATPYEPSYGWYVQKARSTIAAAAAQKNGVIVIGHSAGGWLGRAALGDGTDSSVKDVVAFVSLGAPHFPPPTGVPGVMDMTRGALTWTSENLPGAFLAGTGVKYITVASNLIAGSGTAQQGTPSKAAYESYRYAPSQCNFKCSAGK